MTYKIFKNHINNCVKQSQVIKKNFTEHKNILAPGIWNMNQYHAKNIHYNSIGKIDYYSKRKTSFGFKQIIKNLIDLYYFNFHITLSSTSHNCTYMYLSRGGTIKFFNFKDQFVLTSCPNEKIDNNKNNNFLKVFKTPIKTPIWIDSRKYIIERFIPSQPLEALTDKHFHVIEVVKKYIDYLNHEEGTLKPGIFLDSITHIYNTTTDLTLKSFIEEKIQQLELIDQQLLYYRAHGDFTLRNIYSYDNEYFVIDIDDFGVLLPGFFDVVHLCKSRALKINRDLGLYDKYLNACFKKSFLSSEIPDSLMVKFIIWTFYHSPHYANAISINSHTTLRIDSSWSSVQSQYLVPSQAEQLTTLNS